MNELDLCKAIAELEGVNVTGILGSSVMAIGFSQGYNPITDLALNCMLRDKHKVEVDYVGDTNSKWVGIFHHKRDDTRWSDKKEIPRAVIECILKSKGRL